MSELCDAAQHKTDLYFDISSDFGAIFLVSRMAKVLEPLRVQKQILVTFSHGGNYTKNVDKNFNEYFAKVFSCEAKSCTMIFFWNSFVKTLSIMTFFGTHILQ